MHTPFKQKIRQATQFKFKDTPAVEELGWAAALCASTTALVPLKSADTTGSASTAVVLLRPAGQKRDRKEEAQRKNGAMSHSIPPQPKPTSLDRARSC